MQNGSSLTNPDLRKAQTPLPVKWSQNASSTQTSLVAQSVGQVKLCLCCLAFHKKKYSVHFSAQLEKGLFNLFIVSDASLVWVHCRNSEGKKYDNAEPPFGIKIVLLWNWQRQPCVIINFIILFLFFSTDKESLTFSSGTAPPTGLWNFVRLPKLSGVNSPVWLFAPLLFLLLCLEITFASYLQRLDKANLQTGSYRLRSSVQCQSSLSLLVPVWRVAVNWGTLTSNRVQGRQPYCTLRIRPSLYHKVTKCPLCLDTSGDSIHPWSVRGCIINSWKCVKKEKNI